MQFRRVLFLSAATLLLNSCIFSQKQPGNNQIAEAPTVIGEVVIEDLQAANQASIAVIQARFIRDTNKKTTPLSITKASDYFPLDEKFDSARGPVCKVNYYTRNPSSRDTASYLGMGDMYFGIALQDDFVRMNRAENNFYAYGIAGNIPAGAYQIQSLGEADIAPIAELITVPEQLNWIRVNGFDFGDQLMEYKKHDDLEVSWKAPAVENSTNQMLIAFTGTTEDQVVETICGANESDFMTTKGIKTWLIDKSYLREIPTGSTTAIQITRGHSFTSRKKSTTIAINGLRTFYTKLDYVEN